jgi:hypothetical protein
MRDRSTIAERLGARMREATPPLSPRQHADGRARLVAALDSPPRRGRAPAVFAAVVFAAAAAAIAVLVLRRAAPAPTPVAWHVEHGSVSVGAQGYVSVPDGGSKARMVFDDGSDVSLSAGSRARVASTTPTGAEVVLEQGRANVRVAHRERAGEHTAWWIDAGPYAIQVTGTEFVVAWAPHAGTLDVWMQTGRVVIKGPLLGDALALGAGQHLAAKVHGDANGGADASQGAVQIDGAPAPPDDTPPAPTPSTPPAESNAPSSSAPGAPPPAPRASGAAASAASWTKLVASGDYGRVVQDADSEGIDRAVATRTLDDLRALGDAARYAGRTDVARRAYGALRARFPSRAEARTAAFLTGRLEEEQQHDDATAIRWYDTYLAEAPRGPFAGDALGRKMVLVSKTAGRGAARPLAERYLQLHAGGPYDAAARGLAP